MAHWGKRERRRRRAAWTRAAIPAGVAETIGVSGTCPDCAMTIVAAGNIDNDATIDVWSISTKDRPGAPAGSLFNDVNDLNE